MGDLAKQAPVLARLSPAADPGARSSIFPQNAINLTGGRGRSYSKRWNPQKMRETLLFLLSLLLLFI
jgi:hypothetical protein